MKRRSYVLTNRLSVGMLEEILKQVKNKKSIVKVADRNGLGVEPVLRGFVQASERGKGVGVVLCGDYDFEFDEDDTIDPTEDDLPFDPTNLSEDEAAKVYAFHESVRRHIDSIDELSCGIDEPSDCERVEGMKGIEYMPLTNGAAA